MNSTYRQWLVLRMIPRHGRITASQIHSRLLDEDLELSRRTVERDLDSLSVLFPITCDIEGRTNYWYWNPDAAQLDVPTMDLHTSLAFHLMGTYMLRLLPRITQKRLDPYIMNAGTILETINASHSAWPDKVRMVSRSLAMQMPTIDEAVLEAVSEALFSERSLAMSYRKRSHEDVKAYSHLNPLGLVFIDNLIYLVATVGQHENPLQFLLHRMVSVRKLDQPAIMPQGFSLQQYIDSGEFSYPVDARTITLKALFDIDIAAYLRETPVPGTKSITLNDEDTILLEADVQDTMQLRWWLKGFGDQVEILEPTDLRLEFREMANNLKSIYKPAKTV